jgi:putative DNA primase/helicase
MIFTAPSRLIGDSANLALHFHPEHLADLRASGLTDETIRAAGVYSIRPCDISHFFNLRRGVPSEIESALCFPYQGGDFARIKLFPSVAKMKYSQPSKTGARLYMPFKIGDGAVYICEGEKKTLAAHQADMNAVGIGGLWNWLSKGQPIDDLQLIEWDGREVTIIPDSDVFNRVDLLRAVYALGRELQSLGGSVYVAQIPQDSGAKVGLDDYLLAGSELAALDLFRLDHQKFKGLQYWHRGWKFKKAVNSLMAA